MALRSEMSTVPKTQTTVGSISFKCADGSLPGVLPVTYADMNNNAYGTFMCNPPYPFPHSAAPSNLSGRPINLIPGAPTIFDCSKEAPPCQAPPYNGSLAYACVDSKTNKKYVPYVTPSPNGDTLVATCTAPRL
jgi:hypothetical protein